VAKFIGGWVAKLEGDGCVSWREMGGEVGGDGWLSLQGDGWLYWRGWVAKFIGRWVAMLEGDG
jgi:hypothetical protein